MNVLERCEEMLRQKERYEADHPSAKRGVAGGKASAVARLVASEAPALGFAREAARAVSRTERSVLQDVQIAARIAHEIRDAIRRTRIANRKVELLKLSRLDPAAQRLVADELVNRAAL